MLLNAVTNGTDQCDETEPNQLPHVLRLSDATIIPETEQVLRVRSARDPRQELARLMHYNPTELNLAIEGGQIRRSVSNQPPDPFGLS